MNRNDWLLHLKPGDEVLQYWHGHGPYKYRIEKVERITKTRVIVGGCKYSRESGYKIGLHYGAQAIVEATPELRAEIAENMRRRRLINRLHDLPRPEKMTTEQLEAIVSAYDLATFGNKDRVDARA